MAFIKLCKDRKKDSEQSLYDFFNATNKPNYLQCCFSLTQRALSLGRGKDPKCSSTTCNPGKAKTIATRTHAQQRRCHMRKVSLRNSSFVFEVFTTAIGWCRSHWNATGMGAVSSFSANILDSSGSTRRRGSLIVWKSWRKWPYFSLITYLLVKYCEHEFASFKSYSIQPDYYIFNILWFLLHSLGRGYLVVDRSLTQCCLIKELCMKVNCNILVA